jgi:hypothetical protein
MGPFEMLNDAVVALTQLILILPGNAGYGELWLRFGLELSGNSPFFHVSRGRKDRQ